MLICNICKRNCFSLQDAAPGASKAKEPKVSQAAANADVDREPAGKDDNRGGKAHKDRHGDNRAAGRGAGGRGNGAAAGPEGEQRRPKREFDRRSGTGRGRELSRGGRGAFGAGNVSQEALDAEKNPQAAIEGAVDGDAAAAATEEVVEVEPAVPAEPEPVTFTMDEFMKKREEARQRLAAENAAKPVRAVNKETEFAGMTALSAALDDYVTSAKGDNNAGGRKGDQRSQAKTQVLNVGFKYPTPQPESRDRDSRGDREGGRGGGRGGDREGGRGPRREGGRGEGGRGGGRGGEGRGAGRGGPRPAGGASSAFNPADFPSL